MTTPKARTPADFPEHVAAEHRLHDLQAQYNAAREQLGALQSECAIAPADALDATEAMIGALVSGAETGATLTLDATKQTRALGHAVAEQEQRVSLLHRAMKIQESRAIQVLSEVSGVILRERRGEIVATERAKLAALLHLVQACEAGRALRFGMEQADIRGSGNVWALDFFAIDQLGRLDEPDSSLSRLLREAEEMGIVTAKEIAAIRAGGTLSLA